MAAGRAWAAAQLLIGSHVLEPGDDAEISLYGSCRVAAERPFPSLLHWSTRRQSNLHLPRLRSGRRCHRQSRACANTPWPFCWASISTGRCTRQKNRCRRMLFSYVVRLLGGGGAVSPRGSMALHSARNGQSHTHRNANWDTGVCQWGTGQRQSSNSLCQLCRRHRPTAVLTPRN